MSIPPPERAAQQGRRRRAIEAVRQQLRRGRRRHAEAGAADQDPGPAAHAQDALRAMRRESSDGRA
jgi:hypothetical protein